MREKLNTLPLLQLRELAKARGLKGISTMKKAELVDILCAESEKEEAAEVKRSAPVEQEKTKEGASPAAEKSPEKSLDKAPEKAPEKGSGEKKSADSQSASDKDNLDSGNIANGILEVMADGYGFIRCENYLPGENDVYVAPSQIRRFNLKTGDIIVGNIRIKTQNEKFSALLYVKTINGLHPNEIEDRMNFENMTPIFPNERIRLETGDGNLAMRIMDIISPVGKGQRGMIVSPPKAGKTTLLKQVAKSVTKLNPDIHLIILLIDERPEEVTDIKESIEGKNVEVIYSTFDELPEHHKRVSEMVIERARRLVELHEDVMILLDSITRLSRAYNLTVPPSGRTLSGGLDPAALHMPKRFFGAARNMREGGSLTILATALVETGSKMDDVIYEEFKGTGNMEMVLNRKLQEKRVFPAIDIQKSGTRRDDLLLGREELEATDIIHKAINGIKPDEAVEHLIDLFSKTRTNREFIEFVKKRMV
ncbi:MAG: transcription termination factor Rho [Lachnospiraceae bacterium]|nr:transcription termination factor Rho [Lachnospiraceae bacterium]